MLRIKVKIIEKMKVTTYMVRTIFMHVFTLENHCQVSE